MARTPLMNSLHAAATEAAREHGDERGITAARP